MTGLCCRVDLRTGMTSWSLSKLRSSLSSMMISASLRTLSLHSPLMENPKKEMGKILQVINEYDYVYDDQLNHIEKESILDENNLKTFFDIVISQKQIKK